MKISRLQVRYVDHIVLDKVNLELNTHISILGPNGSGKSSLAKTLCGLLAYKGSILLNGKELRDIPSTERARHIAYIPSKMESFEQFTTVEEFVLMGRYPYKEPYKDYSSDDRKIVLDVLEELKLERLKAHRVHELSSGQQQLVLIAQALCQKSKILIFDEPTSNLDPKNTAIFVKELKKLRTHYKTILISHDIQLAAHLNDPVLFVRDGEAKYYPQGFFDKKNLSVAYDVEFRDENGMIGIAYE